MNRGRGRGRGAGPRRDRPDQGPGRQDPVPGRQGQGPGRQGPEPRRPEQRREEPLPQQQEPPQQPPEREAPKETKRERVVDPEELGFQHKMMIVPALPRKPPRSKNPLGMPIKLISNCYTIELPRGLVYHYDIDIVSKRRPPPAKQAEIPKLGGDKKYRCMSTKRNRDVMDTLLRAQRAFFGNAAYDGRKNIYTKKLLDIPTPPRRFEATVHDDPNDPNSRTEDFIISVQPVRKKDSTTCAISLDSLHALFAGHVGTVDQEAVMAVETILRHKPCQRFFPVGRSFFYPPAEQDIHPLGGGREIWFGFHQSLRLGQWKPMVNLDITATTFYQKGSVLEYIAEFMNINRQNLARATDIRDYDIKRMSKELKNMRIEVNHLAYKRKYRIYALTRERADRLQFTINENGVDRKVTVAQYFHSHYKPLQYPHLPCLHVNPPAKNIFLPIEVCDMVEGQHCKKKLEDKQNAEMIKFTARPPKQRFDEIKDLMKKADYANDEYLREFGLRVSNEPLKLEGRVIHAPNLRYSKEKKVEPREGSWDMRNKQFFRGAEIQNWVFLSFSNPRFCGIHNLEKFAHLLVQIARESGIVMDEPRKIDIIDTRRTTVQKVLNDMKVQFQADLAVIAIPGTNKAIYGEVKQAAETVLGLTTQCIKDDNVVKKCNASLVGNLCQKINAKMGGVNNSLTPGETPDILRKPIIIIGADVTHPAPTHDIKPSLAAAVGSLDSHPSRYAVTCRAQTNVDEKKQSIEIILDLKSMVMELLIAFYRNTKGKKPEKIIFYRDGVSEGQFDKVRDHEVRCIREACKELGADYEPGITFIVVQKRHHTRFMPQDGRQGVGRMRNIPPGTMVDNTVVHPLNFDFFLCSHFGLQGTSRPCHYTVIEDDNNFTADDLHRLTYYLCHTYVRCTKSISCPAPVQYAHLAAFRARQHLLSQMDESSGESTDSSSTYHPLPQVVMDAIKVKDDLKSTMYFV